jgi:hypothetical protein
MYTSCPSFEAKAASKNKFPFLRADSGGISAKNWDVISGCFLR